MSATHLGREELEKLVDASQAILDYVKPELEENNGDR